MKWYSFIHTIAAICLCSLPFDALSTHCNAQTWNGSLKLQQQADENYNFYAQRFNQLLLIHKTHPLLHEEFSQPELMTLWQRGHPKSKQKLIQQLEASHKISQLISEELVAIEQLSALAAQLIEIWNVMSNHCRTANFNTNGVLSLKYAHSNQILTEKIIELIAKLRRMEQRYINEAEALANVQLKPQLEQD